MTVTNYNPFNITPYRDDNFDSELEMRELINEDDVTLSILDDNLNSMLPAEIMQEIFLKLGAKDLFSSSRVCKQWYALSQDPRFLYAYSGSTKAIILIKCKQNKDFAAWHKKNQLVIRQLNRKGKDKLIEGPLDEKNLFMRYGAKSSEFLKHPATAPLGVLMTVGSIPVMMVLAPIEGVRLGIYAAQKFLIRREEREDLAQVTPVQLNIQPATNNNNDNAEPTVANDQ